MIKRLFLALLTLLAPGMLLAEGSDSYTCTYGELQRRVEILRETGAQVPCEVHYHKDSEAPGGHQVLWSATNEIGYCEKNVDQLIAKLEGWGWDCGLDEAEESPAEETLDDTEALTTGEEEPDADK